MPARSWSGRLGSQIQGCCRARGWAMTSGLASFPQRRARLNLGRCPCQAREGRSRGLCHGRASAGPWTSSWDQTVVDTLSEPLCRGNGAQTEQQGSGPSGGLRALWPRCGEGGCPSGLTCPWQLPPCCSVPGAREPGFPFGARCHVVPPTPHGYPCRSLLLAAAGSL